MAKVLPENVFRRHVVVGVCGGVAAYKAVEVVRQLTTGGARVSVILTETATKFIGAATFAALTTEPVRTSLFDAPEPSPHTTLGQSADVIVIVPATARLIGEYAHGISRDLLVATLMASRAPVVLAPAMHTEMWEQAAVQANLALLRERGVVVVDPEEGPLAGGDIGMGRLASTDVIVDAVENVMNPGELAGRQVLVTAGGTREPLDPVRFIGNRSSGKQGYAIAEEAAARGAQVTLISTVERTVASSIRVVSVETAAELREAVLRELPNHDVLVMAAAVADFRPVDVAGSKIKKGDGIPEIVLEPTADILEDVSSMRREDQVIAGFAAETHNVREYAERKLRQKRLDVIVANDVSQPGTGFSGDANQVVIVDKHGRESATSVVSKRTVAGEVLNHVARLLQEQAR